MRLSLGEFVPYRGQRLVMALLRLVLRDLRVRESLLQGRASLTFLEKLFVEFRVARGAVLDRTGCVCQLTLEAIASSLYLGELCIEVCLECRELFEDRGERLAVASKLCDRAFRFVQPMRKLVAIGLRVRKLLFEMCA